MKWRDASYEENHLGKPIVRTPSMLITSLRFRFVFHCSFGYKWQHRVFNWFFANDFLQNVWYGNRPQLREMKNIRRLTSAKACKRQVFGVGWWSAFGKVSKVFRKRMVLEEFWNGLEIQFSTLQWDGGVCSECCRNVLGRVSLKINFPIK